MSRILVALGLAVLGFRTAAAGETRYVCGRDTVVLLHGLSRTSRSMAPLERALTTAGYNVVNVSYPAGRRPIEELSSDLEVRLAADRADPRHRVHFVTHSFGGILARFYLKEHPLPNLGRVVMLGPPNGGSELADLLRRVPLALRVAGPNRPQLGTDGAGLAARLGPVNFDLGVIAGDRSINPVLSSIIPGPDDGFVAVRSTRVQGMTDFLVVPRTHAFIMRNRQVIGQTLKFLRDGSFDHGHST